MSKNQITTLQQHRLPNVDLNYQLFEKYERTWVNRKKYYVGNDFNIKFLKIQKAIIIMNKR